MVATQAMVARALQAAGDLEKEGVSVEVIDPRTLAPLDETTILESVGKTHRLVIAHEAVKRGGFGAEVAAMVIEKAHGRAGRADRPRRRAQRADALQRQSRARDDSEQGGHRRRDQVPPRIAKPGVRPDFGFRLVAPMPRSRAVRPPGKSKSGLTPFWVFGEWGAGVGGA